MPPRGSSVISKFIFRHAADLPEATTRLQASLLKPGDFVTWLRADLCRATLNVEIEATLLGR